MPPKKTPKAITTHATKQKLPRPKRKRPAGSAPKVAPSPSDETWAEGYAKWEAKAERAKRVQCPRCEKLVLAGPDDIHTCYDAKALRELPTPSPIAGQPLPKTPTADAPDFRAIPYGEDVVITDQPVTIAGAPHKFVFRDAPPDTTPYPWPGLSEAWTAFRLWLAVRLTRLAGWVTP